MPIYNYKCKTCGNEFEYEQRITDDALINCPVELCSQSEKGKGEVFRIISKNVGFIFNGSGFYQTDYAKNAEKGNGSKSSYKSIADTCGAGNCACKADAFTKNEPTA